ncbi:MAG: Ribonuclease [Nevskia sp.]|nr:Ribonuclease [Nevskia sp.]
MKALRVLLICLVLVALAGYAARAPLLDALMRRNMDRTLQRTDLSLLDDGRLHVFLCGTAAALPDQDRAGACTAIIADGQFLLIDAGPSSWRVVDGLNLPVSRLSAVLITHLHSDHIGELGEAVEQSWIAGRTQPLDIYGPPGIDDVVQGFAQAYSHDAGYRTVHHGAEFMPEAGARSSVHVLPPPAGSDMVPVLQRNGLQVRAFRVDHAPVDFAYGYRIDWRGRVVVLSGDTRKSPVVLANAHGADLLLHEALSANLIDRASARARVLGLARVAKMAHDTTDYHTTPVEAAELAQAAGVRELVLTHIFPPLPNRLARRLFLEGTEQAYHGKLVLGEDRMRFDLSPLDQH